MKPLALAAATLSLTATSAQALTCLAPDVATTYQEVAAAEEQYMVLEGTLTFDADLMPPSTLSTVPEGGLHPDPVPAIFHGSHLAADNAFSGPLEGTPVTLEIDCAAAFCTSLASPMDVLAFVEVGDGTMRLDARPCSDKIFINPSDEMLQTVLDCRAGESCGEAG
ncbi:hypothetical protein [Pseudoroseicyclus tamaricis]|uniref:Uncharacterized protein n=1 Tax=Pseudoroseicyclus tamaricis TaxID=2705421 RepID=A0A6B2JZL3_9RHOB|nr:hypothetical protein [Pseudoroseicyclus tamaricis]NDV02089.1 hypothetical protein [Pseudoroseicyclus tamaricis]